MDMVMILLGGHVSYEMFGKYSAVLLGKISAIKYCHDMRRDCLFYWTLSCLYVISNYSWFPLRAIAENNSTEEPWLRGNITEMCNSMDLLSMKTLCYCDNNGFLFILRAI